VLPWQKAAANFANNKTSAAATFKIFKNRDEDEVEDVGLEGCS